MKELIKSVKRVKGMKPIKPTIPPKKVKYIDIKIRKDK